MCQNEPAVSSGLSSLMSGKIGMYPLFLFLLLFLPNLLWVFQAADPMDAMIRGLAPNMALVFGLIAWTGCRLGLVLLILLPFLLLVPFESFYIWRYGSPSNAHVLGVIAETNVREAGEYLGGTVIAGLVFVTLLLAAYTLAVIVGLGLRQRLFPHRGWRWVGVAALTPFIGYAYSEWEFRSTVAAPRPMVQNTAASAFDNLNEDMSIWSGGMLAEGYPVGLPFRVRDYLVERERMSRALAYLDVGTIQARTRAGAPDKAVMVLVIGESARSDHWGVNGYGRETTPEVAARPDAISLSNVVSPWSGTRLAVPVILAGRQEQSGEAPVAAPSLVAIFRAAGWKTYWLSNQSPFGLHDSVIAVHAKQADVPRFFNGADYSNAAETDQILIDPFQHALKDDSASRKLIVIHLLGSHRAYHHRYPEEFDVFKPSMKQPGSTESPETLTNGYDNSIRFTDHVLGKLIAALDGMPADTVSSLVYLSDHGQNLPSAECDKSGHGYATEYDFRVASLFWASRPMQSLRPGLMQQIRSRTGAPLYSPEAFHTLLDLASIDYAGGDLTRSWVNERWSKSKRWTAAVADFDKAKAEGACHRLRISESKG